MKLSNLTILFIALTLPIILLLSAYIEIQIDTLALQTAFDSKLENATYDAVSAFKMNIRNNNDNDSIADSLIRNVKASIETFKKSIASRLGSSGYGEKYVMLYVSAIVFTLYDGYYIYTPYEVINEDGTTSYTHTLKPYVYYSKNYKNGNTDIIISYSLDNYVAVYGKSGDQVISMAGYLIADTHFSNYNSPEKILNEDIGIKNIIVNADATDEQIRTKIEEEFNNSQTNKSSVDSTDAEEYYKAARNFTLRYNEIIKKLNGDDQNKLLINQKNDPDNNKSNFVQEKRSVIKESIVENLKQSMYNYTAHSSNEANKIFRLQEFTEDDWNKIYNNICMISFLEGMPVGTKTYNNYSVVASTGNELYTNKEQIYLIAEGGNYYHNLGCSVLNEEIKNGNGNVNVVGYKKTDFDVVKKEVKVQKTNLNGPNEYLSVPYYYLKNNEQACYNCIVERNYIKKDNDIATKAYNTALGRIRYRQKKASSYIHN